MKKQSNLSPAGRKLSLSKRTISNLMPSEMSNKVGGYWTQVKCHYPHKTHNCTQNQNTCAGHNTCYTC